MPIILAVVLRRCWIMGFFSRWRSSANSADAARVNAVDRVELREFTEGGPRYPGAAGNSNHALLHAGSRPSCTERLKARLWRAIVRMRRQVCIQYAPSQDLVHLHSNETFNPLSTPSTTHIHRLARIPRTTSRVIKLLSYRVHAHDGLSTSYA